MNCPPLLTMSRDVIRNAVRARFLLGIEKFETDFAQRQAEHQRHCAVFDDTPPLYNYSQIFFEAIAPYIGYNIVQGSTLNDVMRGYMEVLEFVSVHHEKYEGRPIYHWPMGMTKNEGPVKYERFLQFIAWLHWVQPEVVHYIVKYNFKHFAYIAWKDNFSMENFRQLLKWDQQHGGVIFLNNDDSHLHFIMKQRRITKDGRLFILDKLKQVVAVYGDKYLMFSPTSAYCTESTLVSSLLSSKKTTEELSDVEYVILQYLILTCPSALKIKARRLCGCNAFEALCRYWNNPENDRHVWVVDNVMRYADITDIYDTVPAYFCTLLECARRTNNELVLGYIRAKFGIE